MSDDLAPLSLSGARVLLAGGGGFIASRLRPLLEGADAELMIQDAHAPSLDGLEVATLAGPLTEKAVQDAVRDFAPEFVFDLAGRTDQSHSRDNDDAMAADHFDSARGTARAVFGPALKRWVRCGSNEEYGRNATPYTEDMREMPVSAYSAAKTAATHYLQMLALTEGCPVCTVRPFPAYGPGQARGLIPFVIGKALADEAFDTTEGVQTRDFVYVDDLASGLFAAGTAPGADGEVVNLGTGIETSVRQIIEKICALAGGGRPNFGAMPLREGEILSVYADTRKAEQLLGWQASVSLDDGLSRTVAAAKQAAEAL